MAMAPTRAQSAAFSSSPSVLWRLRTRTELPVGCLRLVCPPKRRQLIPTSRPGLPAAGAAMAGVLKKTTGLVGLAICETPHDRLKILYTKILAAVQKMPRDAAYRIYTEKNVNEKLDLIKTEPNVQKLENKINSGQIEEVILQAENELSLARKMVQWRPWEPLIEEPPADQWKWPV